MHSRTTLFDIEPGLARMLEAPAATDPAGIDAFTSEWLISEIMQDDPGLTRAEAIALIGEAEREAKAGGFCQDVGRHGA